MPTTITSAGITFNDATSLTSANIGTAQLVNGSVTADKLGTTEQKQIAKAWVNFNGTGTIGADQTIRSSYNVSSVTKTATGDYTVNLSTPMADANYSVIASANDGPAETLMSLNPQTLSSSTIRIRTANNTALANYAYIFIVVFGN